ncbi:hypothetical protein Pelo_18640 [Pelomyxa schiedti]|nr:hypothetical protein Pelo_18640 [Pelomyxa schiedti]
MIQWIQSTALFRAWAEDWVLWPSEEAVITLPIPCHYLHVVVSPTLGLVRHSLYTHWPVCGCVGHNRILVESVGCRRKKLFEIEEVGTVRSLRTTEVPLEGWSYFPPLCNRRWVVGFPKMDTTRIWKIVGGDLSKDPPLCVDRSLRDRFLQFSPFCDDVVIVSSFDQEIGSCVILFCDLQASFDQGKLVATSKLMCRYVGNMQIKGVIWRPDGSICTLHLDPTYHTVLVDMTTEKQVARFPQYAFVTPVGRNHLFVRAQRDYSKFKVYNVANKKLTPTPCTWACPAIPLHSGLIAHSGAVSGSESSTEITFTVRDVATGLCVCHFPLCFNSHRGRFDCESSLPKNNQIDATTTPS